MVIIVIWAIMLDIFVPDRQLSGLSLLWIWLVVQLIFSRADLRRVGWPVQFVLGAYGIWFVCRTAIIASSSQGYDYSWVPATEHHRWESPFGLNAGAGSLDVLIRAPVFFFIAGTMESEVATVNLLAHLKLKQMERS